MIIKLGNLYLSSGVDFVILLFTLKNENVVNVEGYDLHWDELDPFLSLT